MLLGLFSVAMSIIITLAYQNQTDRLNRLAMTDKLVHLLPRIQDVRREWSDDADHILDVIEWSGLLNLNEQARNAKLQAFLLPRQKAWDLKASLSPIPLAGNYYTTFGINPKSPKY